ncbi:TPA: hypothetical protein DDZ86_02110 [Candidatus Dependentiae bacterium]|nr:MAG: hypothetical protein UW09_C0001G0217 [candidate division TM6 bacterium GW2011_GWF2_43_87]HBL98418.1 hypothetical protein [Candidatus Dependentiae bacterium]
MKLYQSIVLLAALAITGSSICTEPTESRQQLPYNFYRDYLGYFLIPNTALMNEQKRDLPAITGTSQQTTSPEDKTADLTIHAPDNAEVLGLFLTILSQQKKEMPENLLEKRVTEKLNLLVGPEGDLSGSILSTIPTITTFGEITAAKNLIAPRRSLEELKSLQARLSFLVDNPDVLEKLESALRKIKKGEAMFALFFKPQHKATTELLNSLYFPDVPGFAELNKSTTAISVLFYYLTLSNLYNLIPLHTTGSIFYNGKNALYAPSWKEKLTEFVKLPYTVTKDVVISEIIRHSPALYRYSKESNGSLDHITTNPQRRTISMGDLELLMRHNLAQDLGNPLISKYGPNINNSFNQNPGIMPKLSAYGITAMEDFVVVARAAAFYMAERDYANIFKNFQTKLVGMAHIVEGLEELNNLIKSSDAPELEEVGTEINTLLEHQYGNDDLGRLIRALKTDTFKSVSYFSNKPRILTTNALMCKKLDFVGALCQAGEIDDIVAIARLIKDHEGKPSPFSLATFIDEELPLLKITDGWNLLLIKENPICNSIHLGLGGNANAHFAGPHGSGKSTTMKSFAVAAIMAQSHGAGPFKEMLIAPITDFFVYLDERENIRKNLSTFMAEQATLDATCTTIKNLTPGSRSLTIMDEGIKGTVEKSAEKRVYKALKGIASIPHSMVIAATHLFEPTKLEADTGRFANYYVKVNDLPNNTFERTYKLERGLEEVMWWFKDDEKRERFINWLMPENNADTEIVAENIPAVAVAA